MITPKQAPNELNISLHDKQLVAFNSVATEILYGGAAGGGKSHLMRIAAIIWCTEIAGLQVYLFRRIKEDLIKNHVEGTSGFRVLLAGWVECGFAVIVEDEIRFWNGSKIYLCHCKDEKHRFKYQGSEIHVLLIDELTHFTDKIYRYLRGRMRKANLPIPKKYDGIFPRAILGSNPGGIGHLWVKSSFIDALPEMEIKKMPKKEGGMMRQFIPAKLDDNPTLLIDDPDYEDKLAGLGSDELVKAMRDGDWNVVEGAFFDCWAKSMEIEPFAIPDDWFRFTSFDWGSAKPFSHGWWAEALEDYTHNGQLIPRGALIRYREWYGARQENGVTVPDVGLKLTVEEVAVGILEREVKGEHIRYRVADPAIFSEDGGPSMASRMALKKVRFKKADNARVPRAGHIGGWDQVRDRMKGNADGNHMIFFFTTCRDSIRTIPALQHDDLRPEDLDTNAEDHAGDDVRYGCMSRPYRRALPEAINRDKVKRYKFKDEDDGSETWMGR